MQILDNVPLIRSVIEYKIYAGGNSAHYAELPRSPNQADTLFRNGDSSMIYIDGDALKL